MYIILTKTCKIMHCW